MAKCNQCGHEDDGANFDPCMSVYHDLRCPKCGTTNIDTSDDAAAWAARGEDYGYGNDNFLRMKSED